MAPDKIDEYRQLIQSTPSLMAFVEAGDDDGLAVALVNELPSIPKPGTFLGERGIYDLLGVMDGETFVQTVETMAATEGQFKSTFARVDRWLKDGVGIDVGSAKTQEMLTLLVPIFNAESVAKIIAYGSQKQRFTIEEVSQLR